MKTISILGCGWLGLPLGEFLLEKGWKVKGSTISPEKLGVMEEKNIEPFLVNVKNEVEGDRVQEFLDTDILVVNFPPERREDIVEYHQAQIRALVSEIRRSGVEKVIFVSSTSVYPKVNRVVFEDNGLAPTKSSGKALNKVEQMLMDCSDFETTVIRFGGLIGYDRMPGRFLAGNKEVTNGNAPVNLIHRDDCIGIIWTIIEQDVWGEVFNGCADRHPTRKEYYIREAERIGLKPPSFKEQSKIRYKIVSNQKLKQVLDYEFKYPDPANILEDQ